MARNRKAVFGTVWTFKAGRFTVSLILERDRNYRYDGDDPDGFVQQQLDDGKYAAFESAVIVEMDGMKIAADYLSGSVYGVDEVVEFYTAHRDKNPMNRNCSIMRAKHPAGPNVAICHYFPDMVRNVVRDARHYVRSMTIPPRVRAAA